MKILYFTVDSGFNKPKVVMLYVAIQFDMIDIVCT